MAPFLLPFVANKIVNSLKIIVIIILAFTWQSAWSDIPSYCAPGKMDGYAKVRHIYDGDTVLLEDGRRIRLIGMNAPELGRNGQASEPRAVAARDALISILSGHRPIGLRYGRERYDRYKRVLAHLYLEDGTNINAILVEQGHAAAIAVPPNLSLLECYFHAEKIARQNQRGIWSKDYFRPIPAARLTSDSKGFRLLISEVHKIYRGDRSIWVTLDGESALRIAKKDLKYFESKDFDQYVGRKIIARGWVYPYRGKPVMQIRHPISLQLIQ